MMTKIDDKITKISPNFTNPKEKKTDMAEILTFPEGRGNCSVACRRCGIPAAQRNVRQECRTSYQWLVIQL